jgi:predicted metal-binding membrane protein
MATALRQAVSSPRVVMWTCFGVIVLGAWGYLAAVSPQTAGDSLAVDLLRSLCLADDDPWSSRSLTAAFVMWSAMILAMMLPTAAPMMSTYMDIAEAAREKSMYAVSPLVLAAGYLSVWILFSVAAAVLQAWLQSMAMLTADETLARPGVAGAVLIVAGAYQFAPFKHACLNKCAHPMPYFLGNWRDTVPGVFKIGLAQGGYCVACCWALMLVMFVTGLMNLFWMAIIGIVMIIEKTVAEPKPWSYGAGAILLITGAAIIARFGL